MYNKNSKFYQFVMQIRKKFANGSCMFDADELFLYLIDESSFLCKLFEFNSRITNVSRSGKVLNEPQYQKVRQYEILCDKDGTFRQACVESYLRSQRIDILERVTEEKKNGSTHKVHTNVNQLTSYDVCSNVLLAIHIQQFFVSSHPFESTNADTEPTETTEPTATIQIKRIERKPSFPLRFDAGLITKGCNHSYELRSFVEHSGTSPNDGHYVSCCKYGDAWWLFDDLELVPRILSEREVLNRDPYLLLYSRKNDD